MIILVLMMFQSLNKVGSNGNWLPVDSLNAAKREFEIFALGYSVLWISVFAVVIIQQQYESFDESSYMVLCTSLASPLLLQPILFPMPSERNCPFFSRYSLKANVWIAVFSFIGNYWYTHYFYSVLGATYTFPSWRLNNVPIPLYFATHFYFVTYHTFSNMLLRKIETCYRKSFMRSLLFWTAVFTFSYFTAFMETLTISSFPYYGFKDRFMAYTVGSAFYGVYFLFSFPIFYRLDKDLSPTRPAHTLQSTVMEVFGTSMLVLSSLDLCRLWLGIELSIPGKLVYLYKPR